MKNLNSASKKSIEKANLSKISALGTSKASFEIPEDVVEQACGEFIAKVIENINSKNMVVSGSITDITVEKDGDSINILAPKHLIFQSFGVNGVKNKAYNTPYSFGTGTGPSFKEFVENIKEWILAKGITYEGKLENAAYAIAKSIYNEGIEPKNLYQNEIPDLAEQIQSVIGEYSAEMVVNSIKPKP